MDVYVAPISWGLGDAVVSLPVLQYFIDRGERTYLVVRSDLQRGIGERLDGLAGTIEESALQAKDFDGKQRRLVNLREHQMQTDYWWGSQEFEQKYPGYKINDILRLICSDIHVDANFSMLKPLSFSKVTGLEQTIALIPGSDGTHKQWNTQSWLALVQLLKRRGLTPLILGEPENNLAVENLIEQALPWRRTATIGDAIDVISSCAGIVGVDTGLTHIGVQQGVPTVTMYKRHSVYFRPYPHAVSIEAGNCDPICNQKFLSRAINSVTDFAPDFAHKPWSCEVEEALRCMNQIDAQSVCDKLHSVLMRNESER
jgi:hypothetical protein